MERKLTVTRQCLVAGRTEEIRGAARLITGFLSVMGNKILITPPDALGSSRQMDVGFSAVLRLPLAGRNSQKQPMVCLECAGWGGQGRGHRQP